MTTAVSTIRATLQRWFPPSVREWGYRISAGVTTLLLALGTLTATQAALWAQLGVATVTCLFAVLYATTGVRIAIYTLVGPIGAVLMAYGIVSDTKWAIVLVAMGQLFGISTAAAKVVQSSALTGDG